MKKNLLMLLMAISFITASFAQKASQNLLTGTWHVVDFTGTYPDTMQVKAKVAAEKDIAGDKEKFIKSSFIFYKNGNCLIAGKYGTWKMSSDGKHVIYHNQQNEISTVTINKLTITELIFSREDDGITQVFTLRK